MRRGGGTQTWESCEVGLGQVEMQQAEFGPMAGAKGGEQGPLLGGADPPAKKPVFHLHATVGGLVPADIKGIPTASSGC